MYFHFETPLIPSIAQGTPNHVDFWRGRSTVEKVAGPVEQGRHDHTGRRESVGLLLQMSKTIFKCSAWEWGIIISAGNKDEHPFSGATRSRRYSGPQLSSDLLAAGGA